MKFSNIFIGDLGYRIYFLKKESTLCFLGSCQLLKLVLLFSPNYVVSNVNGIFFLD